MGARSSLRLETDRITECVTGTEFSFFFMYVLYAFLFIGNTDGYFTAIMLKKSRVRVLKHEIMAFPTTSMMRNLLTVHVSEFYI